MHHSHLRQESNERIVTVTLCYYSENVKTEIYEKAAVLTWESDGLRYLKGNKLHPVGRI